MINKHITFLLLILLASSCNSPQTKNNLLKPKNYNWNKLEKMYYLPGIIKKGFDMKTVHQIISENEYSLFDVEKAKKKFQNSKNRGATQLWKGGTSHAIAFFKDGSSIKLELSSNYGVYNILDNSCNYEIINDNKLRSGRWEELLQKN